MKNQQTAWDNLYSGGLTWKKTTKLDQNLKNKSVLELGVGNGKTLISILNQNPKRVTAIDISGKAISSIKLKDKRVNLLKTDFIKFKTKDKFDIIFCYYFLNNFLNKERRKVVGKMESMLNKNGTILFEDFGIGDLRDHGREMEKNTIKKKNGIICHFFDKEEVKDLFSDLDVEINERNLNPIRKDKNIKRKIIKATINNTPGRH